MNIDVKILKNLILYKFNATMYKKIRSHDEVGFVPNIQEESVKVIYYISRLTKKYMTY